MKKYWIGIIGPVEEEDLPNAADVPLRKAVEKAFEDLLGRETEFCTSGWGNTEETIGEIIDLQATRAGGKH